MAHSDTRHTDLELLELLKSGDWEAFHKVYLKYWKKLYLAAFRILRDEDSSKDVVQDLFLNIWERRETLEVSNLGGYLYRGMKNQVAKKLQNSAVQTSHVEEVYEQLIIEHSTEEKILEMDLRAFVVESISQLPERCREIFHLSRFEHKSNKEIAQELGISVSTVENQINKAIKFLRSHTYYLLLWVIFSQS